MDGAKHPRKCAASHQVECFVVAVEEARAITAYQALDLIVCQVGAVDQGLEKIVQRDILPAERRPDLLHLAILQEAQVEWRAERSGRRSRVSYRMSITWMMRKKNGRSRRRVGRQNN